MRKRIFLVALAFAAAFCVPSTLFAGIPEVNVVCPSGIVQSVDIGECQAYVTYDVTITNVFEPLNELICAIDGIQVTVGSPDEGTETIGMTVPVPGGTANCTVTDRDGNAWSCLGGSFNVSIVDDQPPALNVPPDVTVECDESTAPSNTGQATASDNCGPSPAITWSEVEIPGACPQQSTITRTWTATDTSGNTASAVQTIQRVDTTPPSAPAPPAPVTLQCAADVPAPVNLTATDNCGGDITVSPSAVITPGNCNNFTMVRNWTFVDDCGNASSVSQTIIVEDNTPPVAPAPPAPVTLQCAADVPPPVDLTATGGCDGDITVSPSAVITPGSCNNDFTMVRNWTFVDDCGNASSVSQNIAVEDNTPPVITCPPDGSTEDATATDNCTSPVTPTFVDFSNGIRKWTATDECENASNCELLLCDSDPKTAGYWHRQCLGVSASNGGLDPGRKGKGPKAPTEPDFEELLMECADLELGSLGLGETTCSGIDTDPPSDDCERARKHLTALILNLCSDRLQAACPVCLDSCGVEGAADNVTDLIDEIADDIFDGYCKQAAEKAALVNEGEGLCVFED